MSEEGAADWLRSIDSRIHALDWNDSIALALVPLDLLHVDPVFQRTAESPRGRQNIAAIIREFDPIRFGALGLNIRADLSLSVVDGQHRVIAMRQAGRGHECFPALVSIKASVGDEAHRFATQNDNSKPVSLIERFHAGLSDPQDREAQEIAALLATYGYVVSSTSRPGTFRCVATLRAIHRSGGVDRLALSLGVIHAAWHDEVQHVDNSVLRGLDRFIVHYGEAVIPRQLIKILAQSSPRQIRETATSFATGSGHDHVTATVNAIVNLYNVRQGDAVRLPSFMHRTPFDAAAWLAQRGDR